MAFSDFKSIAEVQERYKIKYEEELFLAPNETMPSEEFIRDRSYAVA